MPLFYQSLCEGDRWHLGCENPSDGQKYCVFIGILTQIYFIASLINKIHRHILTPFVWLCKTIQGDLGIILHV